jgi:transposase
MNDDMWGRLTPLLPRRQGRPGKDDRNFLEAVCWMIRTGALWRDLAEAFGPWKSVYHRYSRWMKKGHLDHILEVFKKRWGSRMAHD